MAKSKKPKRKRVARMVRTKEGEPKKIGFSAAVTVRGRAPRSATVVVAKATKANASDTPKAKRSPPAVPAYSAIELVRNQAKFNGAVRFVTDRSIAGSQRLAVLQKLQAASFMVAEFEPKRHAYIGALRQLIDDPDAELRQRSLGVLAREKDPVAQQRLIAGLKEGSQAIVAPEKALQLLSYDVHADPVAVEVARAIVAHPPSVAAKREAVRLLASDPSSTSLLEQVLRDKGEEPEIRQVSAAALQATQPEQLHKHLREILLDKAEQPELVSTALTALTQFGDDRQGLVDAPLLQRVRELRDSAEPTVGGGAQLFLNRYLR